MPQYISGNVTIHYELAGSGHPLLILPPGGTADCDCARATLLAGEATEAGAPVRAGRVRLHAGRGTHRVRGAAHGFSVTLHSKTHFSERTVAPL